MHSLTRFVLLAIAPGVLRAQAVVPIREEPRHRPVHEGQELSVLDIEIPPGDTTLFHRHDTPIAYVDISPMPTSAQVLGQNWNSAGRGTASLPAVGSISFNEAYATAPVEHRVTNLGNGPFRLIAVLNQGPGQPLSGTESLGTAGLPEQQGRWFRSTHRRLAAQAAWQWEPGGRPVVIVQVSSGAVTVELEAGPKRDLRAPGDFVVLQPDARARLRNVGGGLVTLGVVEVR